jgi:hypothetical protein
MPAAAIATQGIAEMFRAALVWRATVPGTLDNI